MSVRKRNGMMRQMSDNHSGDWAGGNVLTVTCLLTSNGISASSPVLGMRE